MVNKVRVHELAKELDLSNDDLLAILRQEGIEVASHLSALDEDIATLVRDQILEARAAEVAAAAGPAKATIAGVDEEELLELHGGREKVRPTKKAPGRKRFDADDEVVPMPDAKQDGQAGEPAGKGGGATLVGKEVHIRPPIIVKDLAEIMGMRPNALITELISSGVFATINEAIDQKTAEFLCEKHGFTFVSEKRDKSSGYHDELAIEPEAVEYESTATESRAPVVAFLGHVDHGKTSLLDAIRKSHVAAGEAGGITQHIGASQVVWNGHPITFLDTPGHEAFTAMRARGASSTDIVVLIVAADDGFMPQTVEALAHARAANVKLIIAMNKIDLPGANPDKVLLQMQQNSLTAEEWGGDIGVVRVSAHTGEGVDKLLERIMLESEMLELRANPALPVRAVVIESQLEQGMGNVVNVLIKNGTIRVGNMVICGQYYGKVKALIDSTGKRIKSAGPSTAVQVVGLNGLPECGQVMAGCEDEKQAKKLASDRSDKGREQMLQTVRHTSLDDLFRQIEEEARKDLKLIVKADVQGTAEAVVESLSKLGTEKIQVEVIHAGVGAVTDNDILLAAASSAIVVGFHVRVNPGVNRLAKEKGVEIRLYSIIYELLDQVRNAMEGMLDPEYHEENLGQAEILKIFDLTKGKVCGCKVIKGHIKVGSHARVYRAKELIYNGMIQSLRRFTDDVKEVAQGFECGIRLDNFADFEPGDVIDVYEMKAEKAKL